MRSIPQVSVVMSVYNGLPYVSKAVESVLAQTLENFEFIIIDDGSTDGSSELLDRYSVADDRIRVFHQPNGGLPAALNRGIEVARGKYIARMDADDISLPDRLMEQYAFMESNPGVGVLGSQIHNLNPQGAKVSSQWQLPESAGLTAWRTLFRCCICHPSTMMRTSILRSVGGYDTSVAHGQDFELWTRLVPVTQLMNHSNVLLFFRRGHDSVTNTRSEYQDRIGLRSAFKLHKRYIGDSADLRAIKFLRNQQHFGAQQTFNRGGFAIPELIPVSRYLNALLEAFLDYHSWTAAEQMEIKEDTRAKLSDVAHVVSTHGRWWKALYLRLKAQALLPQRIPLWVGKGAVRRMESVTSDG